MTAESIDNDTPMSTRVPISVVPTNAEEMLHVKTVHGHKSRRVKILKFIHSKPVQFTLMALLITDVIVLFIEIFLSAEYPSCNIITRDAVSCCSGVTVSESEQGVDQAEAEEHGLCEAPLIAYPDNPAGCNPHKYPALHTAHTVLFAITISILSIFLLELFLLILCLGKRFFRHFFYVLDLVVVSVSFALEITFYTSQSDVLSALSGILVLARLWRFVRVGHGIVEATVELAQHRFDTVLEYNEQLEQLLRDHGIEVPFSEDMHKLKSLDPWLSHQDSKNNNKQPQPT